MDCTQDPTTSAYGGNVADLCLPNTGGDPLLLLALGACLIVLGLTVWAVGAQDQNL